MKSNTEAKLLAGMALLILGGGAFLLQSNQSKDILSPPPATPAPKVWTVAEFEETFKTATHTRGNANSPLQIIEFADAQCPLCRSMFVLFTHKLGKEIDAHFGFMHYPIHNERDVPMHERAIPCIIAMESAGKQSKFWEMQEALFSKQETEIPLGGEPDLSDEFIQKQAKKIGLNLDTFNTDLKDPALAKIAEDTNTFAVSKQIHGTPSFVYSYQGKTGVAMGAIELAKQLKGCPGIPTVAEIEAKKIAPH
jgi:protein-disulfide isomerase